jgi:oligopeptide transport system substrate-binding protein
LRLQWRVAGILGLALCVWFWLPTHATTQPAATKTPPALSVSAAPILRLAMPDSAPTVDPALVADEENVQLAELLYTGLVRLDASYHVVSDAAASFKVSSDRRTFTFYLRKGLKFSNGDPLTASDFKFSINRSLNPTVKSPSAPTYLLDIEGARAVLEGKAKTASGVRVLDPSTLQITIRWSVPYFLMELTYPTSFAVDKREVMKYGGVDNSAWYANPVGSGPYRLKSWVQNGEMVLVPNKQYYGPRPTLKQVIVALAPLPDTDLYPYVTQNLDVVGLPSYDSALLHQAGIRETKMLAVDGVYMNFGVKPFDNIHIRRALTLAINRKKLVTGTMSATVTPFAGSVPDGERGYYPTLRTLPYDPSQARKELKAAGSTAAKLLDNMTLYYADDPTHPTLAKLVQGVIKTWANVLKISISTKSLTLNTLLTQVGSSQLPIFLLGWSADYPDPHDFLTLQWKTKAPNNDVRYSSPRFDALVSAADVSWQASARARLNNQAQQLLADDAAWIPLFIPHRLVFIRPSVLNLSLTGYGLIPQSGTWARVTVRTTPAKPKSHG